MRSTAAWGDPSHTVSGAKQRRVVKAALRYLFVNRIVGKMIRFDVASGGGSGPDASLEYIPDAFDAGMRQLPLGRLFLVATPIGNLSDSTAVAPQTLRGAPFTACEDTPHSRILLQHARVGCALV